MRNRESEKIFKILQSSEKRISNQWFNSHFSQLHKISKSFLKNSHIVLCGGTSIEFDSIETEFSKFAKEIQVSEVLGSRILAVCSNFQQSFDIHTAVNLKPASAHSKNLSTFITFKQNRLKMSSNDLQSFVNNDYTSYTVCANHLPIINFWFWNDSVITIDKFTPKWFLDDSEMLVSIISIWGDSLETGRSRRPSSAPPLVLFCFFLT